MLRPSAALLAALLLPRLVLAQVTPPGFTDAPLVTGLGAPSTLAMPPDGRLFIGEQGGTIHVWSGGAMLPAPLLQLDVETYQEQGLIGMALDPRFATRPYLYVFYTPYTGAQPAPRNRVSRFTVSGDVASPASEVVLLDDIPTGVGYHEGGGVRTSSDDKLWIAIGDTFDGTSQTWTRELDRLEGKLLRLDLDGSIPADNPFVATPGARGEIWQLGLRNPFRFAIEPGTQQPYVDDVGEDGWEEIDRGAPGADFGWPDYEGPVTPPPAGVTNPLYAYPHDGQSSCAAGDAFYTGTAFPAGYRGNYFWIEHSRGQIGRIVMNANHDVVSVTFPWSTTPGQGWGSGPVDLLVGNDGALYYTQYAGGQVRRITYTATSDMGRDPVATALGAPSPNPASAIVSIPFTLAAAGRARVHVFDAMGRRIRTLADADLPPGPHVLAWDGLDEAHRRAAPGVYLVRLESRGQAWSRRLARLE